jgi:hypothetical protein
MQKQTNMMSYSKDHHFICCGKKIIQGTEPKPTIYVLDGPEHKMNFVHTTNVTR